MFDLRLPIGILFSLLGLVLALYGAATRDEAIYARSLGVNVNLGWGLVLLLFGGAMLFFALRKKR